MPGSKGFTTEALSSQVSKKGEDSAGLNRRKLVPTVGKLEGKAQRHVHDMIRKWYQCLCDFKVKIQASCR